MDTQLNWHWSEDCIPSSSEEVILSGNNKDTVIFSIGDGSISDTMNVVVGNTILKQEDYYCWTLFIEEKRNAEIMIGIATADVDFTRNWNHRCRLGMNANSWVLCSGGYLCNNNRAIVQEEWNFFGKDHITVYLNCPQKTLSFAINGKHIGSEYIEIPTNLPIVPVLGSTLSSTVKLITTFECHSSLQLLSFISHVYFSSSKVGKAPSKKTRNPKNFRLIWLKPTYLIGSNMPPGLKTSMKIKYPWFFQRLVHRTRLRPRRWKNTLTSPLLKCYTYPKTIRLKDPFFIPSLDLPRNRSNKRKICITMCRCIRSAQAQSRMSDKSCGHRKALRFLKSRAINYVSSSSDDEIFINKKFKKRYDNVIIGNRR